MSLVLEVRNLSKKYNNIEIIKDINMKVYRGDIYGFIGPNGAGKTTTIKTILGLLKPSQGEVYIDGINIFNSKKESYLKIGAMIDYPSFYPYLSGFKNLLLYANVLNLDSKRVEEVLEMVKLSSDMHKKVNQYSMGMKQRLAVARAFLTKPMFVILDEPTNGLDPEGVIEMRGLVKDLVKTYGTTFVYCSHILTEVQNMCNRIAMINNGRIIVENTIESLLDSNKDYYNIVTPEKNKIKQLLKNIALNINEFERGICIEINKGDFIKINNLMVSNNIAISEISKKVPSLEEYFLKYSKKINEQPKTYT